MSFATRSARPRNMLVDLAPTPDLRTREGKQVRVRLLRSLYFYGIKREAGDELELTEFEAMNLRALKRGEIVQ